MIAAGPVAEKGSMDAHPNVEWWRARQPAGAMPQTATLLLIASDVVLSETLATYFRDEGYRIVQTAESMEGLRLVRAARPDLIIVDAALSADGAVSLCSMLRK